jgi:hypothetical protein
MLGFAIVMAMIRVLPRQLALITALLIAPLLSGRALAQDSGTAIGSFASWTAYAYTGKDGKVCYIMSKPVKSEPATAKRDPIYFLITHRPKQTVRNEISVIIGYPFKKDTTVKLTTPSASFDLFTSGDGAWAENATADRQIIAALKKAKTMQLQGTSARGTATTDSYSLDGLSPALDKIDAACPAK